MTEDSDWQIKWQGHYNRATLLAQQSYLSGGVILLNFRLAEGHRGKVINLLKDGGLGFLTVLLR